MNKSYFLSIVGPTAIGKSALALQIAQITKSCIISMDSMQLYRGMDIGTAKPNSYETSIVKHEMIDILSPFDTYSVSEYISSVKKLIENYNEKNILPILTGGTALYLKSLIYDYSFANASFDKQYREKLYALACDEKGKKYLHDLLNSIDTDTAKRLHFNDYRRVIRAIEIFHLTGKKMSELNDDTDSKYDYCIIGLNRDRQKLYETINKRVDIMIENGLVDEVQSLFNNGLDESYQSMSGIGYKELLDYISGKKSLDTCIESIKQNSRRYAKRQLTFFRSLNDINWLDIDTGDLFSKAISILKTSNIKDKIKYV